MTTLLLIQETQTLASFLSSAGYEVIVTLDIKGCLKILSSQQIDGFILNFGENPQQSLVFFELLKTVPQYATVPVFVILEKTTPEIIRKIMVHEVHTMLAKPFSLDLLKLKLDLLFYKKHKNIVIYDPKVIRIFLESAIYIFKNTAKIEIESQKPFIKNENIAYNDYSAIIGFSNKRIKGNMTVNMEKDLLIKILSIILVHYGGVIDDEALRDIAGELANQILGRAKHLFLQELHSSFELAIPTTIYGKGHILNYPNQSGVLVIPFTHEKTTLYIEFCIEENKFLQENIMEEKEENNTSLVQQGEVLLF